MNSDFSYYMPTKVIFGIGSLNDIDSHIKGRRTLLVTSAGFVKRGVVDHLKTLTNHIVAVIAEVTPLPDFTELEKLYEKVSGVEFDLILALGGGSVMDASKFLSVRNAAKEYEFVKGITKGGPADNYSLLPIISVPTTAGTGSEITPWATIWDMDEKKKYSLHLPDLFCEVALYDPELTLTVPRAITIETGLDTLSHALESIWNKNASPITVGYAVKAAQLLVEYLPLLVDDLQNIKYREKVMNACMYSGLAFSNTQTALAHGLSYYITAQKGVSHGIACSFTLPLLIDRIVGKYDFIDAALIQIFGELSSKKLRVLLADLGVSVQFKDYGIKDDEFDELLASLSNNTRAGNSLVSII